MAAPNTYSAATWNLQGSDASDANKWRVNVLPLARQVDVLAVQEAGSPPGSADLLQSHTITDQIGQTWTVEEYGWDRRRGQYQFRVFFLNVGRLRVNLAMVIPFDMPFRNIRVVASLAAPNLRPALGIELGPEPAGSANNMTFYSVHAASGGGFNAGDLLIQIECATTTRRAVLGDFNREPDSTIPGGRPWTAGADSVTVCPPDAPTHPAVDARRTYDFLVLGSAPPPPGAPPPPPPPSLTGRIHPSIASDHLAVVYQGIK